MGLRSLLICAFTALSSAACSTAPTSDDAKRVGDGIPSTTVTDPATGCIYQKDDKNKKCIIKDFPAREIQ